MTTSVRPIAISGETIAIMAERSARRSSTSRMLGLPLGHRTAAHKEAKLLARGFRRRKRHRQPTVEHHRDAVCDLGQFVEVLADHQYRRPAPREINECL